MRVFVTGATGVVGRRLVPLLLSGGHTVTAVARSQEKRAALERQGAAAVEVDLFAAETVRRAVAGHGAVVNLATHIPPSTLRVLLPGAWRENDRIRRFASAILVEAAIAGGASRFVQESFAPIYDDQGEAWIDERSSVRPARNTRSILDAEQSAARFTESGRVGVVLRFAGFYGPDAFHVHDLARAVQKGFAPLPGSPDAFISTVSHDDAAAAVVAALSAASAGVYNVADDEPLRHRAYVDALADALGVPPPRLPPRWLGRLMGSPGELLSRSQRISNGKLRGECGWAPRYPSVREGWRAVAGELRPTPPAGKAAARGTA